MATSDSERDFGRLAQGPNLGGRVGPRGRSFKNRFYFRLVLCPEGLVPGGSLSLCAMPVSLDDAIRSVTGQTTVESGFFYGL